MKLKDLYYFLSPKYKNLFLEYHTEFRPRYGHGRGAHQGLNALIAERKDQYGLLLEKVLNYKEALWRIRDMKEESDPVMPVWNNGFFPGLDVVVLYMMLSEYRPGKYVEVGSGNSTKVAYKAVKEQKLDTEILSLDPYPRAEIDGISDRIIRQPFEDANLDFIDALEENDVLFIDNSHRILPNSDSMVFFMEVMPRLKEGVIVHIHDVYLPYDYPQDMCERFYSEQYGLALMLMSNPSRYEVLMPNYFVSEDPELARVLGDFWKGLQVPSVEQHGGSFWLRIGKG